MAFAGLKKADDRSNLITYLKESVRTRTRYSGVFLIMYFSVLRIPFPTRPYFYIKYNHTRVREKIDSKSVIYLFVLHNASPPLLPHNAR